MEKLTPREGDPNYLPTVTKIDPNTDLPFGMIRQERDGITTEWLAQGDVKSVPASSNNINVYAEPSGREDEKRKKLLLLLLMPWKKVLQRQQPFETQIDWNIPSILIFSHLARKNYLESIWHLNFILSIIILNQEWLDHGGV